MGVVPAVNFASSARARGISSRVCTCSLGFAVPCVHHTLLVRRYIFEALPWRIYGPTESRAGSKRESEFKPHSSTRTPLDKGQHSRTIK